MSKELTTFVIDLAPCMKLPYNDEETVLEHALLYFYHSVVSKMIKGRVTDFISVVLTHSSVTNHMFGNDDNLKGINVITRKKAPTLGDLREYQKIIVPSENSMSDEATAVEALLVAVAMMSEDAKGAFIRNIVVVTDCESPLSDIASKLAQSSINAVNSTNINVSVIDVSLSMKSSNTFWKDLVAEYNNGKLLRSGDVADVLLTCPPLKRVDPRSTFKGSLRIGSDPSIIENDPAGVSIDIEIYPGVRTEKLPSTKNYLVRGDLVKDLTTTHQYYIEQEAEQEEPSKKVVEKGDWKNGYRYTNKDIHVLDGEAASSSKLECFPAIDVIGTIKIDALPIAYFTEDSYYSVPSKVLNSTGILSFNCLCQALIEKESLLIVRYVQKENSEIKICAMVPCKAMTGEKYVFAMQMVRLPFKEDEKIGRFPSLETDKKAKFKDMERFINARTLDDDDAVDTFAGETAYIKNDKLDLLTHESLSDKITSLNGTINERLISLNPAINKFNTTLIKIVRAAATSDNDDAFINDPEFITKHLTSKNLTNLFNLTNVLNNKYLINDKTWILGQSKAANKVSKTLAKQNKPFKPKKKGRSKLRKLKAGTFGENEDDLEFIDVDALFE